jgi:hypothetical protein
MFINSSLVPQANYIIVIDQDKNMIFIKRTVNIDSNGYWFARHCSAHIRMYL